MSIRVWCRRIVATFLTDRHYGSVRPTGRATSLPSADPNRVADGSRSSDITRWWFLVRSTFLLSTLILAGCANPGGSGSSSSSSTASTATCTLLYTFPSGATPNGPLLVDNNNVYWLEVNSQGTTAIKQIPKSGGLVETLDSGLSYVDDFTVDTTDLYWLQEFPSNGTDVAQILRVPLGGGGLVEVYGTGPKVVGSVGVGSPGIAKDPLSPNVYWTLGGESLYSTDLLNTTVLYTFPSTAQRPTYGVGSLVVTSLIGYGLVFRTLYGYYGFTPGVSVAPSFLTPLIGNDQWDMAADVSGSTVYGLNNSSTAGSVFEISSTGSTVLGPATAGARGVVTDGSYLYYTGATGISAYQLVGNTVTTKSCNTSNGNQYPVGWVGVHGLYKDENYIYVAGSGPSGLYYLLKMTKP